MIVVTSRARAATLLARIARLLPLPGLASVFVAFGSLVAVNPARAQAPADSPIPADAEIRKILVDRVGAEDRGFALVVGVIDANGRRVVACGSLAKNDSRKWAGRSR